MKGPGTSGSCCNSGTPSVYRPNIYYINAAVVSGIAPLVHVSMVQLLSSGSGMVAARELVACDGFGGLPDGIGLHSCQCKGQVHAAPAQAFAEQALGPGFKASCTRHCTSISHGRVPRQGLLTQCRHSLKMHAMNWQTEWWNVRGLQFSTQYDRQGSCVLRKHQPKLCDIDT